MYLNRCDMLKKILDYINPLNIFRKTKESNINLRMMHGINRISFLLFLVCLVVLLFRWFA